MARRTTIRRLTEPVSEASFLPEAPASAPDAPEAAPEPTRRLDAEDLRALAAMDRSELAALLEGASHRRRLSEGDRVEGTVTRVGKEHVFVDIGGKAEASLDKKEVPGARVGEALTAFVISATEDGVVLTRNVAGRAAAAFLETAKAQGVPVEGRVAGRNSGGFEVMIGDVRAFCPAKQIDRHPGEDLDAWVGRTLQFRVTQAGDDVVVSHRAHQEAEIEAARRVFWAGVRVGDTHHGTVVSLKPFGAFVDLGATEGLVPRSEAEGLTQGQAVEVRVASVDRDQQRLGLALVGGRPVKIEGPGDTGSLGTIGDLLKGIRLDRR